MKISAINSNYQTKKSLKKNQLNNNANMTTPSFEGINKLNKVSAKKLALALMAGIAVTTPSLYAAPTKAVTESTIQNTGKNDFYINPDVAKKYPEINPAEHRSFDLYNDNLSWIGARYQEIMDYGTPLFYMHDSLNPQLLNYYVQNPQEKNLPNNEIIQGFVDYYNETKASYMKQATLEGVQEILNLYKEISKKYNVSEQEAVWNCPTWDREGYQMYLAWSEETYYEKNNYFMNPSSENRKKIQDYMISYNGNEDDDYEKDEVNETNDIYSQKVIDEIHKREINTLIHKKMQYSSSKGSDYSKYIEKSAVAENIKSKAASVVTPSTNKSYTTNTVTNNSATSSTTAQRRVELDIKQANLEFNIDNIKLEIKQYENAITDNNNKILSNKRQISNLEYLNTLKQRDIQSASTSYELATASYKSYWRNQITRKQNEINENFATIRKLEAENSTLNNNTKILENAININKQKIQQAENELASIKRELNSLQ